MGFRTCALRATLLDVIQHNGIERQPYAMMSESDHVVAARYALSRLRDRATLLPLA
jgi:hypothetical protein